MCEKRKQASEEKNRKTHYHSENRRQDMNSKIKKERERKIQN